MADTRVRKRKRKPRTPEQRARETAQKRDNYWADPERWRKASREWRDRHREQVLAVTHERYAAHPERFRNYARKHRAKDPDKARRLAREQKRKEFAADPEKVRARARANYHAHKEKRKMTERAWREANPERVLLRRAKAMAKQKGVPFDLSLEDIHVPTHCPVLGIPIFLGSGKRTDNSISIDRYDPRKGYVKGNVTIMSWRANRIKNDGTTEEIEKILLWMLSVDGSVHRS